MAQVRGWRRVGAACDHWPELYPGRCGGLAARLLTPAGLPDQPNDRNYLPPTYRPTKAMRPREYSPGPDEPRGADGRKRLRHALNSADFLVISKIARPPWRGYPGV